jgi:hypothetical protein
MVLIMFPSWPSSPPPQPGSYRFTVGLQDVAAALEPSGCILYAGARYRAISKFALTVLRERNPARQVRRWSDLEPAEVGCL